MRLFFCSADIYLWISPPRLLKQQSLSIDDTADDLISQKVTGKGSYLTTKQKSKKNGARRVNQIETLP